MTVCMVVRQCVIVLRVDAVDMGFVCIYIDVSTN